MRVFVTGSTGWVGGAVVKELLANGHQVLGLARSDKGAEALTALGAEVHRGALDDLESLKRGAAETDGVAHLAFNHDFSKFADNCAEDQRAIETIGAALAGSNRPLLVSSGVALLAPGRLAVESDVTSSAFLRKSEAATAALAARGINATTVRLAPSVHGHGDHGFVPHLIRLAREKGVAAYIGDGQNRWPGVHRDDAAKVYRLALEKGAGGPFHAIADEGVPFKQIAEIIGRRLNIPVVSKTGDDAAAHFGWFAMFAGMDAPTSSARTQSLLGWKPEKPGLLEDIDDPAYFAG